jgi:CDP-2,3-bis-(O-geranylgeranyl)-sn-glycerol synthase
MSLARFALSALWFLLPAGVANTAPVLVRRVPLLARPVDGGRSWRGARLFGDHKTWRGLLAAPLAGWLTFAAQQLAMQRWPALGEVAALGQLELRAAPAWWGAVMGAGAILGDLLKSFAKRRMAIAPGRTWVPFDQLDYVAGAVLALAPLEFPGWAAAAGVLAVGFAAHVVAVAVGRGLGLRDRWI